MTRRLVWMGTLAASAVLTCPIRSAAAGLRIYEVGAPDVGVASAGQAASALDASTAFTNPAGMVRIERPEVVIGPQALLTTIRFEPSAETSTSGGGGGNAGEVAPSFGAYFATSLSEAARLGVSLNSYAGGAVDYSADWAGRYLAIKSTFLTFNLNLAVSLALTKFVSLGVAANTMLGSLSTSTAVNNTLDSLPDGRLLMGARGLGFGGSVGLLVSPLSSTRFGVVYRSPVKIPIKATPDFRGLGPTLNEALLASGLLAAEVDLAVTVPQEVMVGFYHELSGVLAVLLSAGWQDWSSFGQAAIALPSADARTVEKRLPFKDGWHIAAGLQLRLPKRCLWSAGYAYDSSVFDEANRTVALPVDQQNRIGAGAQIEFGDAVVVGAAYQYTFLGSAPLDQERGPLSGRVAGRYRTNSLQVINATLILRL
jgi:long-chain fatty acid transport protein